MPLFACSRCGNTDNTALAEYWQQNLAAHDAGVKFNPLCTFCVSGKWHGQLSNGRQREWRETIAGFYGIRRNRFQNV